MTVSVLFFDLNAYFASVEQQERPELRGRPVAVAPVLAETTCCIAASYEAKSLGVKTGTAVWQARQICPNIRIVEARPELYVRYHHRILDVVNTVLPIEHVHSIDEAACRLMGVECQTENAVILAQRIKQKLWQHIGRHIRCSIGLGPNTPLAKVASNMQKPDGLSIIERESLPSRLYDLKLTALPGVGRNMHKRLLIAGIDSMQKLCAASPDELHRAFGSVLGRWWWYYLRGEEPARTIQHHRTLGHSHVLPPDQRTDAGSHAVLVRLIHKAAARLRHIRYWANELAVSISYEHGPHWSASRKLPTCNDTLTMLEAFNHLWLLGPRRPNDIPKKVGITLLDLLDPHNVTPPLLPGAQHRTNLAAAMDRINHRHGPNRIHFGGMIGAETSAPMRIAFTSIPDLDVET